MCKECVNYREDFFVGGLEYIDDYINGKIHGITISILKT
jgi:hypothetical protein